MIIMALWRKSAGVSRPSAGSGQTENAENAEKDGFRETSWQQGQGLGSGKTEGRALGEERRAKNNLKQRSSFFSFGIWNLQFGIRNKKISDLIFFVSAADLTLFPAPPVPSAVPSFQRSVHPVQP